MIIQDHPLLHGYIAWTSYCFGGHLLASPAVVLRIIRCYRYPRPLKMRSTETRTTQEIIEKRARGPPDVMIIYVALNQIQYLFGATLSAISARQAGNKLPITILTDLDEPEICHEYDINVTKIDSKDKEGYKALAYKHITTPKALILDCDTIITGDISGIFDYVCDERHLAAVTIGDMEFIRNKGKFGRESKEDLQKTLTLCPNHMAWFNSGSVVVKTDPITDKFYETYHEEWKVLKGSDESSFHRALFKTGIGINILPKEYNYFWSEGWKDAKILHRTRGLKGQLPNVRMRKWYEGVCGGLFRELLVEFDIGRPKYIIRR